MDSVIIYTLDFCKPGQIRAFCAKLNNQLSNISYEDMYSYNYIHVSQIKNPCSTTAHSLHFLLSLAV